MTSAEQLRAALGQAVDTVRQRSSFKPEAAVILGTGLGELTREIEVETAIPYHEIPHFPVATVESHTGRLLLGMLAGRRVVAMEGRFHRYEGYTLQQIALPVRVMRTLGADKLIVSNACGVVNPQWRAGDLMLIEDHINLLGDNPLIGPNLDELGPRFPDMSQPYDRALLALAREIAAERNIAVRVGVYLAVTGPNLETRAEYRMLRGLGADVIGMSTIPEVIVANHMGMRCLGISIVTDECFPETLEVADIAKIIATARGAEPKMTSLIKGVLERMK